jgi:aminomethyltransferase
MLKTSPFHSRTAPLVRAQTWRRWAGYQMASAYDPQPDREYAAIRNAAALIDVSPLYKYLLTGRDAARLLDRMITRDMTKLGVGQVYYTPWCDHAGKVIDDGTVSRLSEHMYRLTSADSSLRWLHMNAVGMDVAIEDVSEKVGALSLQGPLSRAILTKVSPADLSKLGYFRLVETQVRDIPVTISRTGYTGDLGYEVWVKAENALPTWDALWEAMRGFGVLPFGLQALYMTRIEAGLLLLDIDFASSRFAWTDADRATPHELGLGWMLKGVETDDRAFLSLIPLAIRGELASWIGFQRAFIRERTAGTPELEIHRIACERPEIISYDRA